MLPGIPPSETNYINFWTSFWAGLLSGIIYSIITGIIVGVIVWRLQIKSEQRRERKEKEKEFKSFKEELKTELNKPGKFMLGHANQVLPAGSKEINALLDKYPFDEWKTKLAGDKNILTAISEYRQILNLLRSHSEQLSFALSQFTRTFGAKNRVQIYDDAEIHKYIVARILGGEHTEIVKWIQLVYTEQILEPCYKEALIDSSISKLIPIYKQQMLSLAKSIDTIRKYVNDGR